MRREKGDKKLESKVCFLKDNKNINIFLKNFVLFLGDFIPVEEPEDPKKGKRHVREEDAEEGGTDEDEDRIDMVNVTGVKEREERREKFYSVQDSKFLHK